MCLQKRSDNRKNESGSVRERKLYIKNLSLNYQNLKTNLHPFPRPFLYPHTHTQAFSIMDISSPVLLKAVSDTNYRLCLSLLVWLFKSGTDSLSPGRHSDSDLTATNRRPASVYVCVTDHARGPLSASVPVCRESRYVLITLTRLAL